MKPTMGLNLFLLAASVAFLSSCGSSKQNSNYDFSSRVGSNNDPITNVDPNTRPLAYCNQNSNSTFSVAVGVFKVGDSISNELINLKFTQIPSYFSQGQNYIQFRKWMATTSGTTDMSSEALKFQLVAISTGQVLTNEKSALYWTDLQYAMQAVNATTTADFFKRVRVVVNLQDPQAQYDVIRTIYYDLNNAPVAQLDTLIPVFDADPSKYAVESNGQARASILQNLHPFKSANSSGWTGAYFQTKANEFCSPLNSIQ